MNKKRKWKLESVVELSNCYGDDLLYREYTLALLWPRSCPEFLTTDEISYWLRKCARENELPWTISYIPPSFGVYKYGE